jgi:uncharacterized protein (TIRG00374 family)
MVKNTLWTYDSLLSDSEKPTNEYKLPKSVMKWVAIGLVISSAVVIAISFFSGVTLENLEKLGYLTFGLAAAASAAKLPVQVLRFKLVAQGLTGDSKLNLSGLALVRVASEFVSLSTPATSMGVFLRTSWLSGKGVEGGKALWIGYFEVLMEIYVGAGLGFIAAVYALSRGSLVLGSTIALISAVLIAGYTILFLVPALRIIKVPHRIFSIASFLVGGPRATALYLRAVVGSLNFSLSAREILNRRNLPVMVESIGLTIVEDLLGGMALWLVLTSAGLKIDPISATLAVYAAGAISAIPVTIGGAGVMELTMQAYLISVYNFTSWASIVLWRIATYQVMLAITGIAFLLFVRKATGHSPKAEQNP